MDVRFELTTNDPWSVDDAICEGNSPLGYLQEVIQSPTQIKPYNTSPLELTGFTGQRVANTRFQFMGIQEYFSDS